MTVPGTAGLRVLDLSLRNRPDSTEVQAAILASAGLTSILLPPLRPGAEQQCRALAAAVAAGGAIPALALSVMGADINDGLARLKDIRSAGVQEALVMRFLQRPPYPYAWSHDACKEVCCASCARPENI